MDPVAKFALCLQSFLLLLLAFGVVGFFWRATGAAGGLTVEISDIPEDALVGRHRAPREWPDHLIEGWGSLAAAYPGSAVTAWS